MSDISFTGLGSGIDTASMIDALMSVEKRPVKRLETKQNLQNCENAGLLGTLRC